MQPAQACLCLVDIFRRRLLVFNRRVKVWQERRQGFGHCSCTGSPPSDLAYYLSFTSRRLHKAWSPYRSASKTITCVGRMADISGEAHVCTLSSPVLALLPILLHTGQHLGGLGSVLPSRKPYATSNISTYTWTCMPSALKHSGLNR